MKNRWIAMGMLVLFLGACESSSDANDGTSRTVASLLSSPPSNTGEAVALDVVVIVSQQNGKKWRAYVQDPGIANGIGLFCDAGATTPCSAALPPSATAGALASVWNPQVASKLEPVSFAARAPASIAYATASTKAVFEGNQVPSGTPAHLSGGPWRVTDATPEAMKNPTYVAGDCSSGPPYFGVELTDESDGTKVSLVLKWFDAMSLTTVDTACGAGKKALAKDARFVRLGGLVEATAFGSGLALEPFSDADWALE